jgi:hypothetical protein
MRGDRYQYVGVSRMLSAFHADVAVFPTSAMDGVVLSFSIL